MVVISSSAQDVDISDKMPIVLASLMGQMCKTCTSLLACVPDCGLLSCNAKPKINRSCQIMINIGDQF